MVLLTFTLLIATCASSQTAQTAQAGGSECRLCFYGPDNMVFNGAGNIYLTDTDRQKRFRVIKLSRDGQLLGEWHVFPEGGGQSGGPEGIALDQGGNVLVTDGGTRSVLKLSPAGKILGRIGGDGVTFGILGHVATDSLGNVYVAEAARNVIQKFDPEGKRIAVWKRARGIGPNEWRGPETIAVRNDGTVVVEDWANHRIVVLAQSGETLFSFGAFGNGPGQFRSSSGLAVDEAGNIYVSDDRLHRIQKFDPSGKLVSIYPKEGVQLFTQGPGAIAVDQHGDLYSPDGLTIVKFSPEGQVLARWR